jgi:hypothetical protein
MMSSSIRHKLIFSGTLWSEKKNLGKMALILKLHLKQSISLRLISMGKLAGPEEKEGRLLRPNGKVAMKLLR